MDTEIMADKRTQRKRARGNEVRYAITTSLEENYDNIEELWDESE